jgi:hypothetical protein
MYHYDPSIALDELRDDIVLPNPVYVRDMLLRAKLDAEHALEMNRMFLDYQKHFGEAQKLAKEILQKLT